MGYLESVSFDHLQGFNWLLCVALGKMGAHLRDESSPFAFRLLIYAPLEILWRMETALFLGSSLNCVLVKSPGNFFNNIVVALVFHVSMYRSSKSLPDSSPGALHLFFNNYIHPSFIPVKNKMSE